MIYMGISSTHLLHGAGIFTNICPCPKSPSFVGKYTTHEAHGVYDGIGMYS